MGAGGTVPSDARAAAVADGEGGEGRGRGGAVGRNRRYGIYSSTLITLEGYSLVFL